MNEGAFYDERKRVQRAEELKSRLDAIQRSLTQLEEFTEMHIGTVNNCGWRPQISAENIKRFVRNEYARQAEVLRVELSQLYPPED